MDDEWFAPIMNGNIEENTAERACSFLCNARQPPQNGSTYDLAPSKEHACCRPAAIATWELVAICKPDQSLNHAMNHQWIIWRGNLNGSGQLTNFLPK
jgi:hypothetical protein